MVDDNTKRPSESTEIERREIRHLPDDRYEVIEPEVDPGQTYQQKKAAWRSYHVIWFFVGIITALLAFRFVFELLGANPGNNFVQMIYTISYPFAGPFETIFGMTNVARSTFDWSVLVAIIVYVLIGYALIQLLRIIRPYSPDEVDHRIRTV